MNILLTILFILFGIYIFVALISKNWNDFFYACCIILLLLTNIPTVPYIIILISLIILHKYIDRKEMKEKTNLSDKENEQD